MMSGLFGSSLNDSVVGLVLGAAGGFLLIACWALVEVARNALLVRRQYVRDDALTGWSMRTADGVCFGAGNLEVHPS